MDRSVNTDIEKLVQYFHDNISNHLAKDIWKKVSQEVFRDIMTELISNRDISQLRRIQQNLFSPNIYDIINMSQFTKNIFGQNDISEAVNRFYSVFTDKDYKYQFNMQKTDMLYYMFVSASITPFFGFIKSKSKKKSDFIKKHFELSNIEITNFLDKSDYESYSNLVKDRIKLVSDDAIEFRKNIINLISFYKTLDVKVTKKETKKTVKNVTESKAPKPKKQTIPKKIKTLVWNHYIGEDVGSTQCMCCKCTKITQMEFQCGHVVSEANGGEITIENLRPICGSCNTSMKTTNMDDFIAKHKLH